MKGDIITEKQDLTRLEWSLMRRSSGTAGSFLKAYEDSPSGRKYYKLSDFDAYKGIIGHECVNELVADRLLNILGIPHLHYELILAEIIVEGKTYETWLCRSEDFKQFGERKIALDTFYQLERLEGESPLDFCIRMGWGLYIDRMLLTDYLILNRDRHGANMEVLQNRTEKTIRPAPLFDHGLSLLCSCREPDSFDTFDVMKDRIVQSFVGSRSARENLQLISEEFWGTWPLLSDRDWDSVTEGLEAVISGRHIRKIREMLTRRWESLESIRNT